MRLEALRAVRSVVAGITITGTAEQVRAQLAGQDALLAEIDFDISCVMALADPVSEAARVMDEAFGPESA